MIAHFDAIHRIGWKGFVPMLAIGLLGAASLVRAQPPAPGPEPTSPNVALDPGRSKAAPADAVSKARVNIEGAAERPSNAPLPREEPPPPANAPAPAPTAQHAVPQEAPAPGAAAIRSIQDPASIRADDQTLEMLRHPQSLELNGMQLPDILAQLADPTKLDIVLDNHAAQEAGIDFSANPLTMRIREPRPAGDLLQLVLRLVNPDLDDAIVNGVVLVSTRGELARHLVTRVYRADGLGNADELANAVAQVIRPESGRPELQFVGSKLIVTAPEPAQRQVRKLLYLLAEQPGEKVDAANPSKTLQADPAMLQIREQLRQLAVAYRVAVHRYGKDSQQARDLTAEIQALREETDHQPR